MAKCVKCGEKYNWFTKGGLAAGCCPECYPKVCREADEKRLAEEYAKRKEEAETKASLSSLIHGLVRNERLQVFGVAYWDTTGTALSSTFDKVMGAAVMGGIGMQMTGKTHRLGVIAVTDAHLYIVELGQIVGEGNVKIEKTMLASFGRRVRTASLKQLMATCEESPDSAILSVKGEIAVKATFPNSYEVGNACKAARLAAAVNNPSKMEGLTPSVTPTSGTTFEMSVDDVFFIKGRGTFATGCITKGFIRIGEALTIRKSNGSSTSTVCEGIEMFRRILTVARTGDNVGVLLRGVTADGVERGDLLFSVTEKQPLSEKEVQG